MHKIRCAPGAHSLGAAIVIAVAVFLCVTPVNAQGVRYDNFTWSTASVGVSAQTVLTPIGGAAIQWCNYPATIVNGLCTNKSTTYTDATLATPCGSTVQVVLQGTSSCAATSDAQGNFGMWVVPGTYVYTVSVAGVAAGGPFTVVLAASNSNSTISADQFTGGDWGTKVAAAVAALPATGGTVDARALVGAQNLASDLALSKSNVRILVGASTVKVTAQITVTAANVSIVGIGQESGFQFWGVPGPQITANSFVLRDVEMDSYSGGGAAYPNTQIGLDFRGTSGNHLFFGAIQNVWAFGWLTAVKWQYVWQSVIYNLQTQNGSNGIEMFGLSCNNSITDSWIVSSGTAGSAGLKLSKDGAVRGEGLTVKGTLFFGADYGVYAPFGDPFLSLHLDSVIIDFTNVNGIYDQGINGLRVTNSWIYSVGIAILSLDLGSPDDLHTSITDNNIQSTANTAIKIGGNNQGFAINGNTITYTNGGYGVWFNNGGSTDNSAIGNHLINTSGTGIAGFNVVSDNAIIIGNTGASTVVYNGTPGRTTAFANQGDGGFIKVGSAIPTTGTWKTGDVVLNSAPSAGGIALWVCTVAGTPGTWVAVPAAADSTAGWKTSSTLTLGSTVVGSLPAAASNSFAQIGVTDSTAIGAEGQNCVGGGAVKAIAISNGTVWKCF